MEAITPRPNPGQWLSATVVRIIDGDTLQADIDLGLGIHYIRSCRIRGYDSPELNSPRHIDALKAQDTLADLLPPGKVFAILSPSWQLDRYARVIGDWYTLDGFLIRDMLPQEYTTERRP